MCAQTPINLLEVPDRQGERALIDRKHVPKPIEQFDALLRGEVSCG